MGCIAMPHTVVAMSVAKPRFATTYSRKWPSQLTGFLVPRYALET
ncbi:hypothetical protein CCACVL1_13892 [Corchorus capsularis]|uniref:Uncharacterized protein n=1 Tax=Corchorus capsularis TaxID=210143 RepID=A0A1R3I955_COCAP|nr:hypothetical protein CCACVL1_13892 [Corchorus capsularis]